MRRKTDSVPRNGIAVPVRLRSDSPILDEESFTRMLCLERKRTERSGRPFVLMLLEAGPLLKAGSNNQVFERVLLGLSHAVRETDTKGWYRTDEMIGVIFTEIDRAHGKAVASALLSRMSAALTSTLGVDEINEIRLSFHIFPEEYSANGNGNGNSGRRDPFLYPDLDSELEHKRAARALKRSLDIAGSLFAILFSAPLLVAIAIAIKLTSGGPVLFRQQRVGQYGRRFTFLKFRSMYTACDQTVHQEFIKAHIAGQTEGTVYKMTSDKRVTPVGRLLRRSSLDELPQFFNVLVGHMSLVGPRPAIPYEEVLYHTWQKQRVLAVKPGITGLWQVGGRSRTKFNEMIRLDLQYARDWTVWMDIKILLQTPKAVISGEGAY
jgi:lipopolysaccharide/colanic/teichoic acid biosynthesis glycosyltransferase